MSILGHAESFRDLVVYQKARHVAKQIFVLTQRFPKEETYSLKDQVRRSSRSVGAQLCEAWAKRRYERHFVSKLTDADGEQLETQHWIQVARECGYLTEKQALDLTEKLIEIGRMLYSMMEKSQQFCKEHIVKEEGPSYFTSNCDELSTPDN